MFICCAYQFCSQQLCYNIMCCFSCQQLFQLFLILFSLFQRRLLKLISILLICCCRVQQPQIIYLSCQKKSTLFFYFFPKRHFNQNAQVLSLFLYILHIFFAIDDYFPIREVCILPEAFCFTGTLSHLNATRSFL